MTPLTSYIIVETQAQRKMLQKKQNEILKGKRSFDTGEPLQRMSEPPIWLVILAWLAIHWFHNFKRKHKKS